MRKPTTFPLLLRAALSLLLFFFTTTAQVQAQPLQARIVYMFDYGFFANTVKNRPSLTDINDLICLKNEYMTELFREMSGNPAIVFEGVNIDLAWDETELDVEDGIPLEVILAADVTTTDGSAVPSLEAMALYPFDFIGFITQYLHTSDSAVWKDVMSLSRIYEITSPSVGQLERGICDGTFVEATEADVTRPPRPGDGDTEPPTSAPTVNPVRVILTALEFKFIDGDPGREPTAEEVDALMCKTDEYFTLLFRETKDPSTIVEGNAIQTTVNEDGTMWVLIAMNVTAQRLDPDPVRIVDSIADITRDQRVDYIANYCWQTPTGNLFRDVTGVEFLAQVSNDPVLMSLDKTCGSTSTSTDSPTVAPILNSTDAPTLSIATGAPTIDGATQAPTITSATLGPTIAGATLAPTPTTTQSPTIAATPTTAQAPTLSAQSPTTSDMVGSGTLGPTVGVVVAGEVVEVEILYDFRGATISEATQEEVEELVCQTDVFLQERIQQAVGELSIDYYSALGGWQQDLNSAQWPIRVYFTAVATYVVTGEPVEAQLINDALELDQREYFSYITNHVFSTSPANVFQGVAEVTAARTQSQQLQPLGPRFCPLRDDETSAPTASGSGTNETAIPTIATTSQPTVTPGTPTSAPSTNAPSQTDETANPTATMDQSSPTSATTTSIPTVASPTDSPGESTDTPTNTPVTGVTPRPTDKPREQTEQPTEDSGGGANGQPTSAPTASVPTKPTLRPQPFKPESPSPTTAAPSPRPTPAPVIAPTQAQTIIPPSEFRSTGIFPVRTQFLVSNLDGLKDRETIRFSSGLDIAWSTFATEMVANVTKDWAASGNRRHLARKFQRVNPHFHRDLTIERVPNSAKVTEIKQVKCGTTDHIDATCLQTKAEYQFYITQEVFYFVNQTFYNETNKALRNGTFQFILDRESPGTPLVIGNIPADPNREFTNSGSGGDDGGGGKKKMAGWAIFLIFLLCLCVVCLPLLYYFPMDTFDNNEKSPAYEEEDFAYDFFIPKNQKVNIEVDDLEVAGNKSVGVEVAPRDLSTASIEAEELEEVNEVHYEDSGGEERERAAAARRASYFDTADDEDGEGWEEEEEEAPVVINSDVNLGLQSDGDSDEWDEDEPVNPAAMMPRGHQGGGQESHEGDPAWDGYDDHLKGLSGLAPLGGAEEESISFSHDHDEKEDEGNLISLGNGSRRSYGSGAVPDMFGGAVEENHASTANMSNASMESENGWEDTSGNSSRFSNSHSEELWA